MAQAKEKQKNISSNDKKVLILEDISLTTRVISQLCVIMPFLQGKGDQLSVSSAGRIYGYTVCTLLVISSFIFSIDVLFDAKNYKIQKNKQGDTEEINQTIETLFCIISYTMIVVSSVQNTGKHCRTYRDIAKIDELLEASGFEGTYSCPLISVGLIVVSLNVIGVAYFFVHIRSDIGISNQYVLMMAYTLQLLLSSVLAIYLRIVLMNLTRRITFVNKKLIIFTKEDSKENWKELSHLIEIFCKFRYIMENMNTVAGVALLFYMGYAFYTVTNQSYLAFSILTTHVAFRDKFDSMFLSIAWVIAEICTMTVICSSCDAISSEANTTSQILARVYGKSKEYQNIIDKFLTKSIKQEVQFTAYGFFVIDNSTLFKIFSAVTTYLVILIQFKQLEDSKMEDLAAANA